MESGHDQALRQQVGPIAVGPREVPTAEHSVCSVDVHRMLMLKDAFIGFGGCAIRKVGRICKRCARLIQSFLVVHNLPGEGPVQEQNYGTAASELAFTVC